MDNFKDALTRNQLKREDSITSSQPVFSKVLNRPQAAQYLGIGQRLFDEYVAMRLIATIRFPGTRGRQSRKYGFRQQDLDAFIERNLVEAKYGDKTA
ncbi:MAG: hypothetical protein A2583_13615 [Bdellovibrionales bacterium RIFOXYD1_FULL_53_11]|nr:MAG: hypothetical protein A2583_13615 [Bdellovibrionales bacterium RIFOXYD1_FULL_53_11]